MTRRQKITLTLVAATIILPLVAVACLILFCDPGVGVHVRNFGDTVLRDVVVEVTGDRVAMGNVLAGRVGEVQVHPTGETVVYIEVTTDSGHRRRLTADVYLEPGYNGYLEVSIDDGRLDSTDVDMLNTFPF